MTCILDFPALRAAAAAPPDDLARYQAVYFLGTHTPIFKLRCAEMAGKLDRFAGALVFEDNADKRQRLGQILQVERPWTVLPIAALLQRPAGALADILVIDFNENLAGKRIASRLREAGVAVVDCLHAMHALGMTHTYLSVREERSHVVDHLDEFEQVAARLTDAMSRRTLLARLTALVTLDRAALIEVSYPLSDFINAFAPGAGIVVRADEVFIDAGAAHGDTVNHFYQSCGGHYRAIHAFEPDASNFAALSMLCSFLPAASAYFAGLGERAGTLDFFEDPANRFGSNFVARPASNDGVATPMRMMAIDDLADTPTLIKIDVEGFEAAVVKGAARAIASGAPNLTISAYHYPHDIAELTATVLAIHPYRYVGLRHYSASLYDTQLMFSDSQSFE